MSTRTELTILYHISTLFSILAMLVVFTKKYTAKMVNILSCVLYLLFIINSFGQTN